jgi:hypothetical protein
MRHLTRTLAAASAAALLSVTVLADTPPPAAAAATDPGALSSSLGLYVFPAKNQPAQTQSSDEASCFGWAKTRTGIDPLAIKPQTTAAPQQAATASPSDAGKGAVAGGAVKGAVVGTAIGAIAGDTGKGAAIGATAGAFGGVRSKRQAQSQAAATQQQQQAATDQAAAQAAAASVAQQKSDYNKAFSACMEGKGYTVK